MKDNKLIFIFFIVAAIIAIIGYIGVNYLKESQVNSGIEEYIPQEEITDEQMRKTMVNLYFYNNETGELDTEARLIDAVELLENPYTKLVQMLIDGPKNEKLKKLMPEDVKVIKTEFNSGCVIVDLSIEVLNYTEDKDLKNKLINSIVNTLTELSEVESVKFLVNGEPNEEFNEEYIKL
ncbi:MAG: GerMN domain-containing protein [Clostridia bacterium]|nr:GerMN domain-containing protein [Clostridia bacterium]